MSPYVGTLWLFVKLSTNIMQLDVGTFYLLVKLSTNIRQMDVGIR